MPTLLAIIPEDGWALVSDGDTKHFVRPPFRHSETILISEATLADAIALYGYKAQPDAPEESWANVIERIKEFMVRANENKSQPSNAELLTRLLRSSPLSVLTALLEKVEHEWLAQGDVRATERALNALLIEKRVRDNTELLNRALDLNQKLNDLRARKEAQLSTPLRFARIEKAARRPAVIDYKATLDRFGSAAMVGGWA